MPSLRTLLGGFGAGMLMGAADIIPGVSGGTIALIVGVYERIIHALTAGGSAVLALLSGRWTRMRVHLGQIHWGLLVPLGAGIVFAILTGARLLPPLIDAYPAPMRGLFLGLVAASLAIPAMRMHAWTPRRWFLLVTAAVVAFMLAGLPTTETTAPSLLRVFATAAVAICAMIVPGVSGAFLLEVFGIYTPTLNALNTGDWAYIITFASGAVIGLGGFARILHVLLQHYHDATMAVLIGLIAGALRALWPFMGDDRSLQWPTESDPILVVAALTLGGALLIGLLVWWGQRRAASLRASPKPAEERS
ncbi:MAG: DUF368 domain-containing protein [Longimonas sp.]|uniref:DUF368 domain-containing protein n=1 Tax=Longimonas sp. TaxID=2039626 RepID=UPI0033611D3A